MRTALVTGANRGIGFEISRQLCFKGYEVILCGRSLGGLNQAAGMLRGEGHKVHVELLDVTNSGHIGQLYQKLRDDGVKLDALINNAAILLDNSTGILEISREEVEKTISTNSLAPLFITQKLTDILNDGARVVMVSSGAGSFCSGFDAWAPIYSLSKTALNGITRYLALAFRDRKIAVNAVCPGWVKTDMGGSGASRNVKQGAETPVWLATEVELGETGYFWRDKKKISW